MSGIGEEMGDVGMAIQRAEDKTAQMQARAGAIDELIASGALDDVSQVGGGDDISRELDATELRAPTSRPSWPGSRRARQPQAIEAADDGDILEAEPEKTTERRDVTSPTDRSLRSDSRGPE